MAYFPIMLMGKVENPRSQTPPCMSDGIQDILDMHNVEILKKKIQLLQRLEMCD